jgi:conjugal transfer pilus assembly protein TraF
MSKRSNYQITIFLAVCLSFIQAIAAQDSYYLEHEVGWHWYHELKDEIIKKTEDPVATLKNMREKVEASLDRAILNPTEKNLKEYIVLQNQISNQATLFSNLWQKVLLSNPELDYSIDHPVNNVAKRIYQELYSEREDQAIAKLAKTTGIFFFYRSSCPYCQKFAPIIKEFSEQYGIKVIAITTDGKFLPEFPDSEIDRGQSKFFRVTVEPSVFAINPYNKKSVPIAYGLISEEELKRRILNIATNFRGDL